MMDGGRDLLIYVEDVVDRARAGIGADATEATSDSLSSSLVVGARRKLLRFEKAFVVIGGKDFFAVACGRRRWRARLKNRISPLRFCDSEFELTRLP